MILLSESNILKFILLVFLIAIYGKATPEPRIENLLLPRIHVSKKYREKNLSCQKRQYTKIVLRKKICLFLSTKFCSSFFFLEVLTSWLPTFFYWWPMIFHAEKRKTQTSDMSFFVFLEILFMTDLSRTERFLSSLSFVNYFIRKKCQHYFLEKKDLTEALGKNFVIL